MATVGTAAMATTADAATVTIAPPKACYLAGDVITVTGTGLTPNASIDVSLDGTSLGTRAAAADGTLTVPITLGTLKAVKAHTVTMTDSATGVPGSAVFTGTTYQVATKSNTGRAGKVFKLRGYGFLAGPKAYMHVRGHGISRDVYLGKVKAPCGTFVKRVRIVPKTAKAGKYKVRFDSKKKYSKKTRPQLPYTLTVFPVFG